MNATSEPQRRPLWLLTLSLAAVGIQALMLSPLLTDIARGLDTGAGEIGFASGAYGIGVAVSALLAAPQLGRWQKRTAIRAAFLVLAAGLLICANAGTWQVMAVGQVIAGLASGVIIPATYALTGDISPPEERSQALGRVLFGWSVSMVAGVPLAAVLSAFAGWRGTFLIVAVIAAFMVGGCALLPKTAGHEESERVSYAAALRTPGVLLGYIATFSYMIGFYQTYTFIGDYVRQLHGAGAWLGGAISMSYGLGFGAGVVFDKWIDATGPRKLLALGLFLVGLNYVVLPFAAQSMAAIAIYPVMWGMANHFCMTVLVSFLGSLSPTRRGTIMGLFSFVTYVSVGVAGAAYGSVYSAHGFFAVAFAATATAWATAMAVFLWLKIYPLRAAPHVH